MHLVQCLAAAALVVATGLDAGIGALAQPAPAESWTVEKCKRYGKDWAESLVRFGRRGLSPEFVERHEAFVAGGCTAQADVCPRSKEELDLANVLVIRAMNAGMASTFLPFACRK